MKEVIERSPNLVLFVEISLAKNAGGPLVKEVMGFLWEQGYTFY